MSWKDELQDASFRGVSFKVDTTETQFGRRNQVHEYPFRDQPFAEDLGKKAREYSFNAYILGDNYFTDRDALVKAIEENDEPGTLIHPTLGTKKVVPKTCSVSFSNKEGGIEFFSLTFVEAGEKKFPSGKFNFGSLVSSKGSLLSVASIGEFTSKYQTLGFIDDIANKAETLVTNAVDFVDSGLKLGGISDPYFSTFKNLVSKFKSTLGSIISLPSSVADGLAEIIGAGGDAISDPTERINYGKTVFQFGDEEEEEPLPENTPTEVQASVNQTQIINLVKSLAAVEIATGVAEAEFPSKQEALEILEEVDEDLDGLLIRMGDSEEDVVYKAAEEMRTAVIRKITEEAVTLPNIVTVNTKDEIPALAFAYEIYGDAEKDQDVIDRNRIRNPLFIPRVSQVEILR